MDFGAFVSLTPGTDGLLHISELSKMAGKRLGHAEEAVDVGEQVLVEVKDVLDGGRKFKLEYVGEKRTGGDDTGGSGSGGDERRDESAAAERGGRDRGERGGRERTGRDRGDRGGRDRGQRGDRDTDRDRDTKLPDRDDQRRGSVPAASDEGSSERTRTRTRSRSRDRD